MMEEEEEAVAANGFVVPAARAHTHAHARVHTRTQTRWKVQYNTEHTSPPATKGIK